MLKHWQTSLLGVLTILGAVAHAGIQYLSKQPVDYTVLWAGVTAGIGLIRAADAVKTGA